MQKSQKEEREKGQKRQKMNRTDKLNTDDEKNKLTKTLPSAVNSAENVGDLFFSVGLSHCAKNSLKSLKRLFPVCKEAGGGKRGETGIFFNFFFFS